MSLARGLAALRAADGSPEFRVTLVTQTVRADFDNSNLPFRVIRRPGLWELWRLVRATDIVHIAGPALSPLILGLAAGKPVAVEHHGFQVICPTGQMFIESKGAPCPGHFMAGRRFECWNCDPGLGWVGSRKLWLLTFVRRFLCKKVAANIMPTSWLGEQLKLPHATTIHHGLVQIEQSRPAEFEQSTAPVIAFQGRLVTTKGVRVLLDAAKRLCEEGIEFSLVIIGDGPERANLERLANQAPLSGRVQFRGRLAPDELEHVLGGATMVVVPSLGGEVFGLVVAEIMQRGLPVIASDLGAFVEVLGDADVIFPRGNVNELAGRIRAFLSESGTARRAAERGRQRAAEQFSPNEMIQRHAGIFRSLR